jgi:hypothetical protein
MPLSAISPIAPIPSAFNPAPAGEQGSGLSHIPDSTSEVSASGSARASARAPTETSYTEQAPVPSATASDPVATLITGYSTTVAGTHYSGNVEQSGSEYTASIEDVFGAVASGSSILSAENNLGLRIDVIV